MTILTELFAGALALGMALGIMLGALLAGGVSSGKRLILRAQVRELTAENVALRVRHAQDDTQVLDRRRVRP